MKNVVTKTARSSTRSSCVDTNSDFLSHHDASVKKRFHRALLASLVFNVVALGAFALSKTAPIAEIDAAPSPMQWTISTTRATFPTPRTAISQGATSSTRSADNAPNKRTARGAFDSAPRRENTQRESSHAENTSIEMRNNSESHNKNRAPRRVVVTENRADDKPFRQNTLATRAQNTMIKSVVNRYSLDRSEYSTRGAARSNTRSSAGESATLSQNARTSSSKGNLSGRESPDGAANLGLDASRNVSGNSNVAEGFGRSASPDSSANAASRNAPLQNSRDESSTRVRQVESASQPEKPQTEPRIEPRAEKPRVEVEPPKRVEVERAPFVQPTQRKREVREAEVVSPLNFKIPKHLRREKSEKSVRLNLDIDEKGNVEARLSQSSGDKDLDEVVLKAARKTRYKPRTEDGLAVKTTKRVRVDTKVIDRDSSDNDEEE